MKLGRMAAAAATAIFAALLSTSAMAQDTPPGDQAASAPATATTPPADAPPTDPAAATAPSDAAAATMPGEAAAAPAPETARIIFFRPSRLVGGAWAYSVVEVEEDGRVQEDDTRIGRLPNGSYFTHEATAGIHNYNVTGPMAVNLAEDRLRIEVEPGETYYVEQTVRMGLITGGFRLVPSTQEEFERRRLRESVPRETASEGSSN